MGNSITAGFQSAGINDSTQQRSYAVLLGGGHGHQLHLPLAPGPGLPAAVHQQRHAGSGGRRHRCAPVTCAPTNSTHRQPRCPRRPGAPNCSAISACPFQLQRADPVLPGRQDPGPADGGAAADLRHDLDRQQRRAGLFDQSDQSGESGADHPAGSVYGSIRFACSTASRPPAPVRPWFPSRTSP